MADKKSPEKKAPDPKAAAAPKSGKKSGRKVSGGAKVSVFMMGLVILAAVFMPYAVLLGIGMLPTIAATFADPKRARTKIVTVGALNLAGCVPFLFKLGSQGHEFDTALNIATDPQAVIVMYAAAGAGYMIDWSMSSVVAAILYQRGLARQESIKKRQAELVSRWGAEVTGQIPLDHQGFAVERPEKS
ncbi:MAG: hypothetical protein KA155_03685 [Alphaproteobacteria bacterium]|jgi:hypothetical protein|nr:hypothetical protein [Alphaproteobacteria bacterium]